MHRVCFNNTFIPSVLVQGVGVFRWTVLFFFTTPFYILFVFRHYFPIHGVKKKRSYTGLEIPSLSILRPRQVPSHQCLATALRAVYTVSAAGKMLVST